MDTKLLITIPKNKVLRRLGHTSNTELDARTEGIIDKEIETAYKLIKPSFVMSDLILDKITDEEAIFDNLIIPSLDIIKKFKNVKKATLFIVSIGGELEKETGNVLIDTIRDAIGSEAVEELAEEINKNIIHRADKQGYKTLTRFSVGYGDWDIEHQRELFRILKPKFVKLGNGNIMHPMKSISAIVGWEKK